MKKSRPSETDWKRARVMWECEPLASYSQIADFLGVSKALAGRRGKAEGWKKRISEGEAAARAQAIVAAVSSVAVDVSVDAKRAEIRPTLPLVAAGVPVEQARAEAEKSVVNRRAEIELTHTREYNMARSLLYGAIKSKDSELTRQAKMALEAMKLLHDGERRLWRLDGAEPMQIIIERE